jgi:hypothetical protein
MAPVLPWASVIARLTIPVPGEESQQSHPGGFLHGDSELRFRFPERGTCLRQANVALNTQGTDCVIITQEPLVGNELEPLLR